MHLPHTLLTFAAACGLWWAGHAWSCSQPALQATVAAPRFGVPGSAYGSLVARTMRDSLYSYWHGGERAVPASETKPKSPDQAAPPPPPPGRFSRLGRPQPPPPPAAPVAAAPQKSWFDRAVTGLSDLETSRTRRNNRFPLTPAHRRYINASAGWRLRLAYEMDPGDAILYEILHFHLSTQGQSVQAARKLTDQLAADAIQHGLSGKATMSDALTGAGAALNLLNDQLMRDSSHAADQASILANWQSFSQCLERYRQVRKQADDEGWWEGISESRRNDIASHAEMLQSISETVRKTLVARQILPQPIGS